MKTMSKKLYAGIFSGSLGFFLLCGLLLGVAAMLQNFVWFREQTGLGVQLIAILGILGFAQFLIVQSIYTFVILWKMWSSIQDGNARTTPGKAIGFLFIPFFNIYWIFKRGVAFRATTTITSTDAGCEYLICRRGCSRRIRFLFCSPPFRFWGFWLPWSTCFYLSASFAGAAMPSTPWLKTAQRGWGHQTQYSATPDFIVQTATRVLQSESRSM
jgi:hypothetical protein